MTFFRFTLLMGMWCTVASSQSGSRVEQIEAEREEKAKHLQPEVNSGVEKALLTLNEKNLIGRTVTGWNGLRVKFGGLPVAQGFALGPEYVREELAQGNVHFRGSAIGSQSWSPAT